jgi:hypothetical protein
MRILVLCRCVPNFLSELRSALRANPDIQSRVSLELLKQGIGAAQELPKLALSVFIPKEGLRGPSFESPVTAGIVGGLISSDVEEVGTLW